MNFSTRLRWLFLLIPSVTILLVAGGLVGVLTLQRNAVRSAFAPELVEEGGVQVDSLADEFFAHLEHHVDASSSEAEVLAALVEIDGDARAVVALDHSGENLLPTHSDPQLVQMLDAEARTRLLARARRDGDRTVTLDNYPRFLSGELAYPIRAQFRVFDSPPVIIGHGRAQGSGRIRLETTYGLVWWQWLLGVLVALGLSVLGLVGLFVLSRILAHRWVGAPLAAFRAEVAALGSAVPDSARELEGSGLEAISEALRGLSRDHSTLRTELAEERSARYEAEETRDRLQSDLRHILAEETQRLETDFQARLQRDRATLYTRVARALTPDQHAALGLGDGAESAKVLTENIDVGVLLTELSSHWNAPAAVTFELRAEAGLQVSADSVLLRRAVQALLDNAVRALGDTPEARISLEGVGAGEYVEIRVTDNGPGISEALRPLVVMPLFSTHADALGTGLSFAAELAVNLGGALDLKSEVGKGTVVILRIPAA